MAGIAIGVAAAQWGGLGAIGSTSVAGILGGIAGSYVDSAFLMPALFGQDSSGPAYGGLNLSAADEGSPIWRVHGEAIRVPGLVLHVNEPRAQSQTNRLGKRGETTTRTWYTDCVMGFGKVSGTSDNYVERVYVNNTLVIDQRADVSAEVYIGQTDVVGVGTVAGVVANYDGYLNVFGGGFGLASLETSPRIDRTVTYSSHVANANELVLVTFVEDHGISPGNTVQSKWTETGSGASGIWGVKRWWSLLAHPTDPKRAYLAYLSTVGVSYAPPAGTSWSVEIASPLAETGLVDNLTVFDPAGKDLEIQNPTRGTRSWPIYDARELPNGRYQVRLYPSIPGDDGDIRGRQIFGVSPNPNAIVWHLLAPERTKFTLTQEPTPYNLSILEGGRSQVEFGYGLSQTAGGTGTADQVPMPKLVEFVGETLAPGYRDMFALAFEDWNLSSTGNALGNPEAVVRCDDTTIGEVVTSICATHGMDTSRLDVSGLSGTVRGYRYSGVVDGRQALQPLILAFDIRSRETGDGVVLFHTEDSPTLTVPEGDWISDGSSPRLAFKERNTQISLGAVQVKFLDANKDQAPGTVTEVRQSGTGGEVRVLALDNLVLTASEAREIARRVLRQTKAQQFTVEGWLPMPYSTLSENTVITTTVNSRAWRFRVTRADVGANFAVQVYGLQEEVYTS